VAKKLSHNGIVVGVADGAHGGAYSSLLAVKPEGHRGVLGALVRVVDDALGPPLLQGHVEQLEDQLGA
jgi:hypothetical protein